jgi:hypothetical protein
VALDGGKIFQYLPRATPENNALRAKRPEFIGKRKTEFRFKNADLERFGLRIMNPLL